MYLTIFNIGLFVIHTWQFNFILYLISVICFFQFYKLGVKDAKRDGAATVTLQFIASISILFLFPFFPLRFPNELKWYLLLSVACIFYALNDRLQTTVRKHLQVSVFSIINQLNTVFLIIFGITFFHEPITFKKLIGIVLILSANVLLRYSKGKIVINKYIGLAILATLGFATALSIDIGISGQFNLPIYIMLTLFIPALFVVVGERIHLRDILFEINGLQRNYYVLTGVFWALTIFFSLRSFQLGKITTIVPLQSIHIILNVIVAYVFLGERKDEVKKIVSAVLVMAGVYLTILN